jgi:amidohydrolase
VIVAHRRRALGNAFAILMFAGLGAGCRAYVDRGSLAPEPAPAAAAPAALRPATSAGSPPVAYRPDVDGAVQAWIDRHLQNWVRAYERLHARPELSLAEHATAEVVAAELGRAGYRVTTGVGGTGVVGVLANGAGPVVLVRADMDALPVREETGLSYASTVSATLPDGTSSGVMHACGHDVHVTTMLATATLLAELRQHWSGTVIALAQPAEELGRGAEAMIRDGLFTRFPKPDACLALHVASDMAVGELGITPGFFLANVDSVDITVYGRGGHGARPENAVDPIVASAHLVTALQTLVSRRVSPVDPAVVTVGSIHGGTKHNVIPDQVTLQLTVRSFTEDVRRTLLDGIRQLATDVCTAFRCPQPPLVQVKDERTPAAYNDPALAAAAAELFRAAFGSAAVVDRRPEMGGEDFGRYAVAAGVPGFMFRLGSVAPERLAASRRPGGPPLPSLHSSRYAPVAAPTLATGVRAMTHLVLGVLAPSI